MKGNVVCPMRHLYVLYTILQIFFFIPKGGIILLITDRYYLPLILKNNH